MVIKYIACHDDGIHQYALLENLKLLFPELEESFKYELDRILKVLNDMGSVQTHVVQIAPGQPPHNPGNTYKPVDSYMLTQNGKAYSKSINNPYVEETILPDSEKTKILLDRMVKHINVMTTDGVNVSLRNAIMKVAEELPKREWYRIYSTGAEYAAYAFFKDNGYVTVARIDERGKDVYEFNKRAKKLVEIGSFEGLYEWERERKYKNRRRQELSDKLLEMNIDTIDIHKKQHNINVWIAIATMLTAVTSIFQIYDKIDGFSQVPFATITVMILSGGIAAYILLVVTQKKP